MKCIAGFCLFVRFHTIFTNKQWTAVRFAAEINIQRIFCLVAVVSAETQFNLESAWCIHMSGMLLNMFEIGKTYTNEKLNWSAINLQRRRTSEKKAELNSESATGDTKRNSSRDYPRAMYGPQASNRTNMNRSIFVATAHILAANKMFIYYVSPPGGPAANLWIDVDVRPQPKFRYCNLPRRILFVCRRMCARVHVNAKWQLLLKPNQWAVCLCALCWVAIMMGISHSNERASERTSWPQQPNIQLKTNLQMKVTEQRPAQNFSVWTATKWCDCNQIDLIMFYRRRFWHVFQRSCNYVFIIIGVLVLPGDWING